MIEGKGTAAYFITNKLAPLEHLFGNHKCCTENCPGKKATLKNEPYNPKTKPLSKDMHRDIYYDILECTIDYFTPEQ
eukprot:scaffold60603_cov40-Attheya_sp.AAC.1